MEDAVGDEKVADDGSDHHSRSVIEITSWIEMRVQCFSRASRYDIQRSFTRGRWHCRGDVHAPGCARASASNPLNIWSRATRLRIWPRTTTASIVVVL
jgi:hypothetical protein